MKRFKGSVSTDKVGSETYFYFEVPDDATELDIEDALYETALNYIYCDYEEAEK